MIKQILLSNLSGKKVLLFFILSTAVYAFMLLFSIPKVSEYAEGLRILDMMPGGYDFNYAYTLLETLGEEGRHAYLFKQLPVDFIYPTLFAINYCLLFSYLLKRIQKHEGPLLYFSFLPFIAGIADYIENVAIIKLITKFPEITEKMVSFSNSATLVKSTVSTVYFVGLLILIIVWLYRYIRKLAFQ